MTETKKNTTTTPSESQDTREATKAAAASGGLSQETKSAVAPDTCDEKSAAMGAATTSSQGPEALYPHSDAAIHQQEIASMIRVNQAGEYGAGYIYKGQLDALHPASEKRDEISHMRDQELNHLRTFNEIMVERRVRPTLMSPLWKVAGYTLGYVTAKMGEKAAMACTVAVEEVIDDHYREQEKRLASFAAEKKLQDTVHRFRLEELEHRDTALEHGARETPGYAMLSFLIKGASKFAIAVSKRL